jgi:hypothetical protein
MQRSCPPVLDLATLPRRKHEEHCRKLSEAQPSNVRALADAVVADLEEKLRETTGAAAKSEINTQLVQAKEDAAVAKRKHEEHCRKMSEAPRWGKNELRGSNVPRGVTVVFKRERVGGKLQKKQPEEILNYRAGCRPAAWMLEEELRETMVRRLQDHGGGR